MIGIAIGVVLIVIGVVAQFLERELLDILKNLVDIKLFESILISPFLIITGAVLAVVCSVLLCLTIKLTER